MEDSGGPEETTRQRLVRWLAEAAYDFEELRLALEEDRAFKLRSGSTSG